MEKENNYSPPLEIENEIPDELETVSLDELYKSWEIFEALNYTLETLPIYWLKIFNIARNLYGGTPPPGVEIPQDFMALLEKDMEQKTEKRLTTKTGYTQTLIPSNEIEVKQIEELRELPKVLPPQLLLQDIAPDVFDYKLLSKDLAVFDFKKPKIEFTETSEQVEEVVLSKEKGKSERQNVYALFDISPSMRDDNKFHFAKAIFLTYLAKAHEEGADVSLRTFSNRLGNRFKGNSPQNFRIMANEIMSTGFQWGTDINLALSWAVYDINDDSNHYKKPLAEILLITDGESQSAIPLLPDHIKLHTLLLKGGHEGKDNGVDDYQKSLWNIKRASKTFTVIDTSNLALPENIQDALILKQRIEQIEDDIKTGSALIPSKMEKNLEDIEKMEKLSQIYQRLEEKTSKIKIASSAAQKKYEKMIEGRGYLPTAYEDIKQGKGEKKPKGTPSFESLKDALSKIKNKLSPGGIKEIKEKMMKQKEQNEQKQKQKLKKLSLGKRTRKSNSYFDFRIKDK